MALLEIDDLAVAFLPLMPAGLWELTRELGIRLVEVPEAEYPTLGCNVLAIRPGVVLMASGNPTVARGLAAAETAPTTMTSPIWFFSYQRPRHRPALSNWCTPTFG